MPAHIYLGEYKNAKFKEGSRPRNAVDWKSARKNCYNEILQVLIDLEASNIKQVIVKFRKIVEPYDHFVSRAAKVVMTVVDSWEGKLSESTEIQQAFKKCFPDMDGDYLGIAGGTKISYEGIFYKFSVENPIYNSLSDARKSLSRELCAITHATAELPIDSFQFPLAVMIDYKGVRVLARSSFPLGEETLESGSQDAKNYTHPSEEALKRLTKLLLLGIGPSTIHGKSTFGPCDMEQHIGEDDRWYMVDLARIFPAEPSLTHLHLDGNNNQLINLFRPELIKRQKGTISSEANSPHSTEKDKDRSFQIFDQCVKNIIKISEEINTGTLKIPIGSGLMRYLHAHGICVLLLFISSNTQGRHLGILVSHIEDWKLRKPIAQYMAFRTVRQELRTQYATERKIDPHTIHKNFSSKFMEKYAYFQGDIIDACVLSDETKKALHRKILCEFTPSIQFITTVANSLLQPRIKKICFPALALGTAYYFGKKYAEAIKLFDSVLEINPDNFTAHTNRYFALKKLGKSTAEDLKLAEKYKILEDNKIKPRHPFHLYGTAPDESHVPYDCGDYSNLEKFKKQVSKSQVEKRLKMLLRDHSLRGYVDFQRIGTEEYLIIKKSNKPGAEIEFQLALSESADTAPSAKSIDGRKIAINPAGTGGEHNRHLENTVTDIYEKDEFYEHGKFLGTIDRGELTFDTAIKVKEKLSKCQVETTRIAKGEFLIDRNIDHWLEKDFEYAYRETFKSYHHEIFRLNKLIFEDPIEDLETFLKKIIYHSKFYPEELKMREQRINKFKPDATITIEYTLAEPENALVDHNHFWLYVPGGMIDRELCHQRFRYELARLLLSNDLEESIRLATITKEKLMSIGLKPLETPPPNSITHEEGIYHRNFAFTRITQSPTVYIGAMVANNTQEFKTIMDCVTREKRLDTIATAIAEATQDFLEFRNCGVSNKNL